MYPNRELLSAHVDGEVPSPWKEHIHRDIEQDEATGKAFTELKAISATVRSIPGPEVDGAQDRVYAAVTERTRLSSMRSTPIWRKRVPLPVAAAAGLATAILGALIVYATGLGGRPAGLRMADEGRVDVTINVDDEGLEDVIQWLNGRSEVGQVRIELPEVPRFEVYGEPTFRRSSDFEGSRGIE